MRVFFFLIVSVLLISCNGINKVLKSSDPSYKLRMAEQYYAKKKYALAQQVFEDVMPFFKTGKEFEDIYYKYAYCAYYQKDYANAENLFKTFLEIFPNSSRSEEMDFSRANCFYKQSPKPELDQTNTMKAMGMMQVFINRHPDSERNKEAAEIFEICRKKLEKKDFFNAQLYYDISQFRAAGVAFNALFNAYPESANSEEYKFMVIKSYFKFAEMSIEEKKINRFEQVISECHDFIDRFPNSKLSKDVQQYLILSQTNIKDFSNEQTKASTWLQHN